MNISDRHVYGTAARRELSYDNVKVSSNAWDTNLIKVNPVGLEVIERKAYSTEKRLFPNTHSR